MSPSPREGLPASRSPKSQEVVIALSYAQVMFIALFSMQEQYQNWLNAIEQSEMPEYKKQAYSGTVLALSKTGAPAILNPQHLALLIGIDHGMLKRMYYARDKFYRTYTIRKRSGGERLIEAPYPSLKMVQRWILDNILTPTAVIHPSSVGFARGKTIVDNARPHLGADVLLKMDIKDFFPSITEASVKRYFMALGYDVCLSGTLGYLCCKDGRLPQGAPTSPLLSNAIYRGMDMDLDRLAYQEDLRYTRYADDLTFSGSCIPVPMIKSISETVKEYNLRVNREKTRRSGKGSRKIITGVSISSGIITIHRERKRAIRQKIHYILTYGLYNHLKHTKSRDLLAGYRLLGELAYWHSVEPENQYVIEKMDALKQLLNKGRER